MAARLDVNLERLSELDAALLKSGEAVTLREGDDGILTVETSDSGLLLGGVAAEHAAALAGSEFVGHVRTLKKNSDTNIISGVTVRFVRGERSIRPIVAAPQLDEFEEEDRITKLSREQLEQLANNEDVRRYLRDERLQRVVHEIDGAPNREAALKSMLQAPNFKEFTDAVLNVVVPQLPE